MKKIYVMVAFVAATIATAFAQNSGTSAPILTNYYNIKDALVAGNATLAASKADDLKNFLSASGQNGLAEASRILLKEVTQISGTKDIKVQRAAFSDLSNAVVSLAKTEKLSAQPIYKLYCPMKKSYWLSNEKVVKNPYYGASMLTCGKVEGTI